MAANANCPIPGSIDPLTSNGFMFNISKLPNVSYFCQEANLPEITLGSTFQATPFVDLSTPGDKLAFGDLSIQFMVDSKMANYTAIHDWLFALGFPQDNQQFTDFVNQDTRNTRNEAMRTVSDAVLSILGPLNTPVRTVQFRDLYPLSLSSIIFRSTNTDVQYIVGNATFKYAYYEFTE